MTLPDTADFDATYGGAKVDYDGPIEDPTTDVSALEGNNFVLDAAMMTRTCPRAIVEFTGIASSPAVVSYHEAMWGNDNSVKPAVTWSATGKFHVTWPATITDKLGVVRTLNLQIGRGFITSGTNIAEVIVTRTGPNTFDVSTYSAPATPTDLVGSKIGVEVR